MLAVWRRAVMVHPGSLFLTLHRLQNGALMVTASATEQSGVRASLALRQRPIESPVGSGFASRGVKTALRLLSPMRRCRRGFSIGRISKGLAFQEQTSQMSRSFAALATWLRGRILGARSALWSCRGYASWVTAACSENHCRLPVRFPGRRTWRDWRRALCWPR